MGKTTFITIVYGLAAATANLIGGLFVLTQMAWPLIRGTKMFPLFRRQHKLESKLRDLKQEQVEKGLAKQVERETTRLEK